VSFGNTWQAWSLVQRDDMSGLASADIWRASLMLEGEDGLMEVEGDEEVETAAL
jgi:hypothetical protein